MTKNGTSARRAEHKGKVVPKDKKKKHKTKKADKAGAVGALAKAPKKAARGLKALSDNPLVADVVAAALIGMASALRDSDKARKLAGKAGDELGKMAKSNAKQGGAMWDLALDIGRQTLAALAEETKAGRRGKSR